MSEERAPRRDPEVDAVRTILWFRTLGERLGSHTPREIQRVIDPATSGKDSSGELIRNNKFLGYSKGEHVPQARLVQRAAQVVPHSAYYLNHPLWQALRTSAPVNRTAHKWVRELAPEIQRIVLSLQGELAPSASRHTLGALERRAGLDSLTALTILFRINQEHGQKEWAWACAASIFRVLLLLGPWLEIRLVDMKIFKIYVERVFSCTTLDGKRMALERYDYPTRALLLQMLADELKECFTGQRERKLPHFYALQVLDGKRQQSAARCFQIPVRNLGDECS